MNKITTLSLLTATILMAGGDIAPVAPVTPAPTPAPAACDFYGSIAAEYVFVKDSASADSWGKKDNEWGVGLLLGVDKKLGNGFGIGAEIGATTHLGLKKIAENSADESADLTQLYLTYTNGNTSIKAGRFTLPELSQGAFSDVTYEIPDVSFEGLLVVNKDIADTTLVGAWISKYRDFGGPSQKINGVNKKGLFMLGAQYEGIKDTTITASAYYVTEAKWKSLWLTTETKVGDLDVGVQAVYDKLSGNSKSTALEGYIGGEFNGIGAKLTLAYLEDNGFLAAGASSNALWIDGGDYQAGNFGKEKMAKLELEYGLANDYGTLTASATVAKPDNGSTGVGATVGYEFTVAGVDASVEYEYIKNYASEKSHTITVGAVYKF